VSQWAPSFEDIFEQRENEEDNLTQKASSLSCSHSCSQESSQKLVQRRLAGTLKKRPTTPPKEIMTLDLPGSNFMGPMEVSKQNYDSEDELDDSRTVEVVEVVPDEDFNKEATVYGEEDEEEQEDGEQTTHTW
jgi:hypothetical protein